VLYVANAEDPEEARRQIAECYERFLVGLGITDAPRGRNEESRHLPHEMPHEMPHERKGT
jgi:hypothetical protein